MSTISRKQVNPIGPTDAKIFILGDCPNSDDEFHGEPFSGRAGDALNQMLAQAGIFRESCRLGNILNFRPRDDDFDLARNTPVLDQGITETLTYITQAKPTIIVPLGGDALSILTGDSRISKWRGSVIPFESSLIIPTYHPKMALRDGSLAPQIAFDFSRIQQVLTSGYKKPEHRFTINPDTVQLSIAKQAISEARHTAVDIETIRDTTHILSVQFAWSAKDAVCLINPLPMGQHDEYFLRNVQDLLDSAKEIEFHNGTFDVEQLRMAGVTVDLNKYTHDTMFCQRTLEPELPIGLDFCTSIYTWEPYYKDDGKQNSKKLNKNLWDYGCKDVICTWQTREVQETLLAKDPMLSADYEYNHSLIPVALEFQSNGLPVDPERLNLFKSVLEQRMQLLDMALKSLAGAGFNHRSPNQVKILLYKQFGLPERRNQKGKVSTDEEALVSLIHYCQKEIDNKVTEAARTKWEVKLQVLKVLLDIRECAKLLDSYIDFSQSHDGRVRHSIKIAGTGTGRWAASLYVDGTGLNAQAFPRTKIEVGDALST